MVVSYFGPFVSGITKNRDLPVGISQNVENLGVLY